MSFYPTIPDASADASAYYAMVAGVASTAAGSAPADSGSNSSASRPSSTSPSFPSPYQSLYKYRSPDAGRGFDPDDDTEFCPALKPYSRDVAAVLPTSPPAVAAASRQSPNRGPDTPAPARTRKAIDIIDPITGMRVR